jgi:hypothetical protein
MKFKVGDRIRVVNVKDIRDFRNVDYKQFINACGVIVKLDSCGNPYGIKFDDSVLESYGMKWWKENELEFESIIFNDTTNRDEVIYAIEWLLINGFDTNEFTVPNGSTWTYENLIKYVKNNLR